MFALPDLPYAYDALSSVISAKTMHHHHDNHHAKYVDTLNQLLKDAGAKPQSLEAVVRDAAASKNAKVFNNAAQSWNHAFFWLCMTGEAKSLGGDLAAAVDAFGGVDALKTAFVNEGIGHFGSGWVWLAARGDKLEIVSTHDGENLLTREGLTPLLVCDLWEHAYYLDHQQDRKGYIEAWFDKLADWSFAGKQYAAAKGQGEAWSYPAPSAA